MEVGKMKLKCMKIALNPQPDPVDTITTYLPISNYQYYLQGPLNPLVLTYCHDSYTTLTTFAITKYPTHFESYNLFTCK